MISRTDRINNANSSLNHYTTQKSEGRGQKNLFVGGKANDVVVDNTDEAVILTGGGNDDITSTGTKNRIESNGGNNIIKVSGSENTVKAFNGNNTIVSKGDKNAVVTNNGNNSILAIGSNNSIQAGTGNDEILALGNYNNIDSGDGNNSVVFEGDNININAGNGNNYIASLDFAIAGGKYADFASYLDGKSTVATTKNALMSSQYSTKEISRTSTSNSNTTGQDIINQLSAQDKQILNGLNLNEQINGQAKYVIARGSQDGAYHIYQYSNGYYRAMSSVSNGNIILVANASNLTNVTGEKTTTTNTTVVTQDVIVNNYADITKTTLNGNKNVSITTKDGNNNILVNGENSNVQVGNGNNNLNLVNGIVVDTSYSNQRTEEVLNGAQKTTTTTDTKKEATAAVTVAGGSAYTYDPLIIDFNQDGKISAQNGKGIDLDGNGTSDGAAVGGDKMLAISDVNGNAKIDGTEVFGDKTVDPFTGKALNAANGFEALKLMAQSAQANTNIKCIDENGLVDLKALNQALQTKGIKLGFVSDENDKQIEDLTKVAYINTNNYKDQMQTGSVQNNQIGTSIFEDGTEAIAADVWFESAMSNNPFDISKLKEILNK